MRSCCCVDNKKHTKAILLIFINMKRLFMCHSKSKTYSFITRPNTLLRLASLSEYRQADHSRILFVGFNFMCTKNALFNAKACYKIFGSSAAYYLLWLFFVVFFVSVLF